MSTTTNPQQGPGVDVRPVSGTLGAEITGVRLGPDLGEDVVAGIRAALLDHKVVFLRGQEHLDDAGHAGFVRRLGPLTTAHPTISGGRPEAAVLPVDSGRGNRANSWHSDVTFVDRPPSFTTLRAQVLPPSGGDTVFADTVAAYRGLPAPLRALADELWAEHSNDYDYATAHATAHATTEVSEAQAEYRQEFISTVYRTRHPVVRVHPETGARALLLGHFVQRFPGLSGVDGKLLFELFQAHVTRLENTVRWRWSPGDIALWDNRSTQHYAVADYGDAPRRLHRVTVAGEVPVGTTGEHSIAIAGDSRGYAGVAPSAA
ncbi:TauD/TfdA dioxygenase family protein [Pseudonocardia nantongensis]|uniref:TauD/TfdA dioxygenase family protein n=1 Tax=Pseudonocardia nantongensis TaxID=1181885 RepID=UPI00397C1FAF